MNSYKTIFKRWVIIAMGFILMAIIFYYFYQFSPIKNNAFFPSCSFKSVTGWECVGCGGQRAVHEILHLRFISALDYNAFFVMSIPLLLYYIFFSIRHYIYGIPSPDNFLYSPRFGLIFIVAVFLFMILRNIPIPGFEWLNSVIPF